MRAISDSEARHSLKSVLVKVVNKADVTLINRPDVANVAVMPLGHCNA
jgi:PHD/YefM family antitoxin component YafN of YafNO toxin-antitoxin module